MSKEIELGDVVRDKITGFTGVAIGRTKWIHGCERITIQPQELKEGKPIDSHTFDLPQLELVTKAVAETTGKTGGPGPVAARRSDARR